jgi:hypothetical protein
MPTMPTLWSADAEVFDKVAALELAKREARLLKAAQREPISERERQRRAQARDRAEKAIVMRTSGMTWQAIADALGYANASGPFLAIKQTLKSDPRQRCESLV